MFQFFANDEQIKEIAEITESGNMPDEEFLAILPAKILAFSFLTKEWSMLNPLIPTVYQAVC